MQLVHLKSIDENITYEKSDTIKNENLIEKKLEKSQDKFDKLKAIKTLTNKSNQLKF